MGAAVSFWANYRHLRQMRRDGMSRDQLRLLRSTGFFFPVVLAAVIVRDNAQAIAREVRS